MFLGDIAYYDENGYTFICDRIKELIKVNGKQVPPAELESILLGHDSVVDCCVIGIPDEKAGELPRAYIVSKGVSADEIHCFVNGINTFD
uniref:AMP-binding_C domain-containing protein n=1 Tax=Heterorhabditis bacteriophora TaxID=37862 RepID=A0A1I7XUG7_HETBA